MSKKIRGRKLDSVENTCSILDLLLNNDELGVTEIANELDLTPGTVHCYLNTLREYGYVVQEDGKYRLGSRYIHLAEEFKNRIDGFEEIKHELGSIADECNERVKFAIEEQGKVVYIYQECGENAVKSSFTIGQREDIHCVAIGKAILAHYPNKKISSIVKEHGLAKKTPNTITDHETLLNELERIREQGYAVDNEERIQGVRCIAVPIFRNSEIIGAISVTGPARRMNDERLENDLLELLLRSTNVIEVNSQIRAGGLRE